jgi:hypothetical protein
MVGRTVNACASPDWPKPLYQWGACGTPLVHSFGCSMAHAGPDSDNQKDSARKTNTQVYFRFAKGIIKRIALASWRHLATLDSCTASLAVRAPLWLTPRCARLYLEHECTGMVILNSTQLLTQVVTLG